MADDIKAANYKKSVDKITDNWAKKVEKLAKDLAPINDELAKLEAIKEPSPDDKKRIDELTKKREEIRKKIDTAGAELRLDLMLIEVPQEADEKELVKLPGWFKDIVKKKGIPLGKNVTLVPDLSIDFKKKKVKSAGITLKWEF
jgi:hypothetical protein